MGARRRRTVWFGAAEKLPVVAAARVNAMMSDAAASDDSDLRTIVHQGTTVCAAALAVAQKTGSTGEEVLAAIVLGYEASGRVSTAIQHGFKSKGFHGCIIASLRQRDRGGATDEALRVANHPGDRARRNVGRRA